jgi:hypothetical protein
MVLLGPEGVIIHSQQLLRSMKCVSRGRVGAERVGYCFKRVPCARLQGERKLLEGGRINVENQSE